MHSPFARLVAAACLVLVLVACSAATSDSIERDSVVSVTIHGGDVRTVVGRSLVLTAAVDVTGNAIDTVAWSSSSPSVATVDASGAVASLAPSSTIITAASTADPSKSDSIVVTVDSPGTLHWTRQFGTPSGDFGKAIAAEANGASYVVGFTNGILVDGSDSAGTDVFVRAYDGDGSLRWTRQFGTDSGDFASGVASDTTGNVYVVGTTFGALHGDNVGSADVFVRSFDIDGDLRWTRQFGTAASDNATAIATDTNGDVYAAGYTFGDFGGGNDGSADAFVTKYSSDGDHAWTRQFGTDGDDRVTGVATDANDDVYATGNTGGVLEGVAAGLTDVFIRAFDSDGAVHWTRQLGTFGEERANGIATDDALAVYVTGSTDGSLDGISAGGTDAYISKYASNGVHLWTRQFGTSSLDVATGIATGANGDLFTTGRTNGSLAGSHAGGADLFASKHDDAGELHWIRQVGTASDDVGTGIATDSDGNAYVTGETNSVLEGASSAGSIDAFVIKYGP